MEKLRLLKDLSQLLNVPQFERIIFHKVEELKTYLRDEIELYRQLQQDFRKTAYGELKVAEDPVHLRVMTYRFQLDRDEQGRWVATDLDPAPPVGSDADDIMPAPVIDYITGFNTHPTRIETVRNLTFPDLEGRSFDLRFAKYSDYHALGTIAEIQAGESPAAGGETDNLLLITDTFRNGGPEMNYKELLYYMEKFPALKEHMFAEFFMCWKPLLDQGLVDHHAARGPS